MKIQTKTSLSFEINASGSFDFYIKGQNENEYTSLGSVNTAERQDFTIDSLTPASIYDIKIMRNGVLFDKGIYITQSNSTGEIKHFFDHEVVAGAGNALIPDGKSYSEVEKALRDLIKSAKISIDYCAYNTNVTSIVNALIDAKQRGIRIRAIADNSTSNTALQSSLPFEVLKDKDDGLMHNKFIIIDSETSMNATVVTGSMNFTSTQMTSDPNHLMFIQDQALSKAYTIEFEEMWGSKTEKPDLSKSKFSSNKTDNTPHIFNIGGIPVECYFSPSDNTSTKIKNKLKTATNTLDLSLFIFTYNELKNQVIDNVASGVKVNGIIDDEESSKSVIDALKAAGASIIKDPSNQIYHYKMAMIDAEFPTSNPILITGSHNWTFTAETKNDENLLIIQDYGITNLYKRAMYYWWNQGTTSIEEAVDQNTIKVSFNNQVLNVSIGEKLLGCKYYLADNYGRVFDQGILNSTNNYSDLYTIPCGLYVLIIEHKGKIYSRKIMNL